MSISLLKSSGVYVISNLLNRAVPFLLLPILTRYLSPADVGRVTMFTLGVTLAVPLMGLCTDSAVSRQYFERDTIDFSNYVTNCLYVWAVTTLVSCLLVWGCSSYLSHALELPSQAVWAIVIAGSARYLTSIVLNLWQVQNRPHIYAIYFFLQTVVTFGLSIYFVVGLHSGWTGRMFGEVISTILFAIIALGVLIQGRWIRHGVNMPYLRHAVTFGGGLVPHLYGGFLLIATDRILIAHMVGLSETGLYAVGAQIGMIIGVLEASFNLAWSPWLFERLKQNDPEQRRQIAKFTQWYNIGIISLALALGWIAPWALKIFVGKDFTGAAPFVFWLALGNAFNGMYKMVVNPIFYANKTHLLAMITFTVGIVNIALCYVLISVNGAIGGAQATAVVLFLSYLFTRYLSSRVMPMPALANA